MKQSLSFYNTIYRLYPFIGMMLAWQRRKLARIIEDMPPGNLLEIGTGCGALLHSLQRHRCTGIDNSQKMLDIARHRESVTRPAFRLMNGEQLQFPDDHFDYIVLNHVLSVTAEPEKMLQEAHRVLCPGGTLLLHNHFTPDNVLRYIDRALTPLARLCHFRSVFRVQDLQALRLFSSRTDLHTSPFQYFRLLILNK